MQLCQVTCQLWKRALWVQNVTLGQEHHRDVRDQLQEARLALGCACGVCRERLCKVTTPSLGLHFSEVTKTQERVRTISKNQLFVLISRVSLPFPGLECFRVFFLPVFLSPVGFKGAGKESVKGKKSEERRLDSLAVAVSILSRCWREGRG